MNYKILIVILVVVFREISSDTGPLDLGLLRVKFEDLVKALKDVPQLVSNPPRNNNNSIQYRLFTVENRNVPCYIEPSVDEFDKCFFKPDQETKVIIHGYLAILPHGNLLEEIKDALLDNGFYNVIIVDWTLYDDPPFRMAYRNARLVGIEVSKMMKFIVNHTGASAETFHLIGHSLGVHVCGQAGRLTPNLGRITGLDPGGLSKLLSYKPNIRLRHTDANFVDVIHTSDSKSDIGRGGYLDAIGHMDFYPNGGVDQPHCRIGRNFKIIRNRVRTILSPRIRTRCKHFIPLEYFRHSIFNNCSFIATKCDSYSSYKQNQCAPDGNPVTAEMGFPCKKIPGLPPGSKFYLDTLKFPPYCKEKE